MERNLSNVNKTDKIILEEIKILDSDTSFLVICNLEGVDMYDH
jgi:hypothetical protein